MIISVISSWAQNLSPFQRTWILVLGSILLFFGVFRLWAFTLKPIFRRDEPAELPYWIPYMGHALEYVKNGQHLLTRAREYFGDTREPFAITLGGEKLFFVTSPEDASILYKSTDSLVFDKVVHDLTIVFGISRDTVSKVFRKPTSPQSDSVAPVLNIRNPGLKSLSELNNDFWKQQLNPGPLYNELQKTFLKYISEALRFENLNGEYVLSYDKRASKTVSLLQMTQSIIVDAALSAFFGNALLRIDPDIGKNFLEFDYDNWKLWYKWPKADAMFAAKKKVTQSLERYLALPEVDRQDASFIVHKFIDGQRALGTPDDELASLLCMIIFVTNTNTYKSCFWSMAYLLNDDSLMSHAQEEISNAFDQNDTLDLQQLMTSSPWLNAVFNESLRMCSASSSMRIVTNPVIIGGKRMPVGSRVIVPFRQLHFNKNAYGSDVDVFNPERFIRSKNLAHSANFTPFGGGTSYCPGRHIARQEVNMFTALLLRQYNVEVIGGGGIPALDTGKPTTGLMSPKDGEDLLLRLTPKV